MGRWVRKRRGPETPIIRSALKITRGLVVRRTRALGATRARFASNDRLQ
jgi:hypothetical protein